MENERNSLRLEKEAEREEVVKKYCETAIKSVAIFAEQAKVKVFFSFLFFYIFNFILQQTPQIYENALSLALSTDTATSKPQQEGYIAITGILLSFFIVFLYC